MRVRGASSSAQPARPLLWATVTVLASFLAACHRAPPAAAPAAVVVALPVRHDAGAASSDPIRYPVEALARYSNVMSFRVPGKLIERAVRIGDRVQQGQVIAKLDPADAQKQAASAKAALGAAEHRLVFARQQLERDQAQGQQNLIATNQLEQTQDAFTAALAGRDQAAAQLAVARNALDYNTLVTDHDGLITSEDADTGQVVSAGQPVYRLAWTGDTDVILDAAESDLGRIAVGQAAVVTFPALPGRRFDAHIREIAPAADPQSRTYRVKLTLKQPAEAVRFGMTGDATLAPPETADSSQNAQPTYTLPATAIFHKDNSPAVWVVGGNDSTLQLRPVEVRSHSDHSSVVSAGLHDGDMVVLAGVHTVYAGEHVHSVKPLFDDEGDIEGPATSASAVVSQSSPVAR